MGTQNWHQQIHPFASLRYSVAGTIYKRAETEVEARVMMLRSHKEAGRGWGWIKETLAAGQERGL